MSFESKISSSGDGKAVLTNRSNVPIIAWFFEILREPCSPMEAGIHLYAGYDAGASPDGNALKRFESRAQNIGAAHCNKDGTNSPATASLRAALFADGSTLGDERWIAILRQNRMFMIQRIEGAIGVLKQMKKGQTREECVSLLENARAQASSRAMDGPTIEFSGVEDPYESAIGRFTGSGLAPLENKIADQLSAFEATHSRMMNELPAPR